MKVTVCILLLIFCIPLNSYSQKRIKPPKRPAKIESVDQFVDNAFNLYHKVFVYDSLTKANVEIPSELENDLIDSAERDVDSLLQVLPTVFDDMTSGNKKFAVKAKATINLNKAKKALKFSFKAVKEYFVGAKEED